MVIRSIALFSALTAVTGKSVELPMGDIPATSRLGSRILSQARQLDGEDNMSWVAGYSIKFEKCATSDEYYGGYFGGEEGGNDRQNFNGMYKQRLVHFKLCPTGYCGSSCANGADYVVDMGLFVQTYLQSKMEAQEYDCEMVRENCNCENANDDEACEQQCYANAGLDYCEDNRNENNNNGQQQMEFNLEDAAECRKLEIEEEALQAYYYQNYQGNNGQQAQGYNYYGQQGGQGEMGLFVGPYCTANGKKIHLGVFQDETCSYMAEDGIYEKFSYGQALPYSSESLISDECISCKEPQDANEQNNGDQQDEDNVLEICERLYEDAGKCETGLGSNVKYYPVTYGCDFISSLHAPGKMNSANSGVSAAKVFAGLFAVTTAIFGAVAYYFHMKQERTNVQLSGQDGALA